MFEHMDRERRLILDNIIQLVYFMRGAIQYRDMLNMSQIERQAVATFLEKRLEAEKDKMYQNY